MSTLNRRIALTAVAGLPAMALPAAALAACARAAPDPIYAAIEARRQALARWDTVSEWDGEEYMAVGRMMHQMDIALCATVPTTLAGVRALLAIIIEFKERGADITQTLNRTDETNCGDCGDVLLETLHTAIGRFA
jgi:hypothetical protein